MQPGDLTRWLVVFDLDGTLVETAPDLIEALNATLASEGLDALKPDPDLRLRAGQGAAALIRHGAARGGANFSDTKIEQLRHRFIAWYGDNVALRSEVFEGVEPCLARLQGAGARLAVCTNKEGRLARKLLTALGLDVWFSAVVGHDEVGHHKPHGDHLRSCVERAGGETAHTIMVGDSATDVGTARANGVPVILVDFGYSMSPVADLGADAVVGHCDEIAPMIARLVALRRSAPSP